MKRTRTSGFLAMLKSGSYEHVLDWHSHKQAAVSRSSCESEFIALGQASAELLWLRGLLMELKLLTTSTTVLTVPDTAVVKVHLDSIPRRSNSLKTKATLEKPGTSGSSSILCETSWRQGLFPSRGFRRTSSLLMPSPSLLMRPLSCVSNALSCSASKYVSCLDHAALPLPSMGGCQNVCFAIEV